MVQAKCSTCDRCKEKIVSESKNKYNIAMGSSDILGTHYSICKDCAKQVEDFIKNVIW